MNSKMRLYAVPGCNASLSWQRHRWQQYFDIVDFDLDQLYDDGRAAVIVNFTDYEQYSHIQMPLINDHLFDSGPLDPSHVCDNVLTLQGSHWMWINEQWGGVDSGYSTPRPPDCPTKFFLMPMNLQRDHRDRLFADTHQQRQHSIWSYVVKGTLLPGDTLVPTQDHLGTANDRLYQAEWYADTCFSLVSESTMDTRRGGYGQSPLFVSEKSFKPLAYRHPFVIQGTSGTLQYIKSLGFETFAPHIDESYDSAASANVRQQMVLKVVNELYQEFIEQGQVLQCADVQNRTQHNYELFWDQQKVTQLFEQNIVNTIVEFVESR
jgi:hypothetical protein